MTKLTKAQRRYLARHECAWCGQRLDRKACGAIWEQCSEEVREKRRADCLGARIAQAPAGRAALMGESDD